MDTPLYDKPMPTARPFDAVEVAAYRVCLIHEATRLQQQIDNLCASMTAALGIAPSATGRDQAAAALYDIIAVLQPQKENVDG